MTASVSVSATGDYTQSPKCLRRILAYDSGIVVLDANSGIGIGNARSVAARAIAYEKFGRWFDAEEPLLRAKERTDAGSSAFQHPRSELIAPLPQDG